MQFLIRHAFEAILLVLAGIAHLYAAWTWRARISRPLLIGALMFCLGWMAAGFVLEMPSV